MKKIGNIVVKSINMKTSIWLNKCLSFSDIDKSLPTLIIGLENARSLISDFNILKKSYQDNMIWWTFSKSEKRDENIEDTEKFVNFCIERIKEGITYELFDLINVKYSQVKQLFNILSNDNKKYFYNDRNKFIYLYNVYNNTIYGISLDTCEYCGIIKSKILGLINKFNNITEINDFSIIPGDIRNRITDEILSKIVLFDFFT